MWQTFPSSWFLNLNFTTIIVNRQPFTWNWAVWSYHFSLPNHLCHPHLTGRLNAPLPGRCSLRGHPTISYALQENWEIKSDSVQRMSIITYCKWCMCPFAYICYVCFDCFTCYSHLVVNQLWSLHHNLRSGIGESPPPFLTVYWRISESRVRIVLAFAVTWFPHRPKWGEIGSFLQQFYQNDRKFHGQTLNSFSWNLVAYGYDLFDVSYLSSI